MKFGHLGEPVFWSVKWAFYYLCQGSSEMRSDRGQEGILETGRVEMVSWWSLSFLNLALGAFLGTQASPTGRLKMNWFVGGRSVAGQCRRLCAQAGPPVAKRHIELGTRRKRGFGLGVPSWGLAWEMAKPDC